MRLIWSSSLVAVLLFFAILLFFKWSFKYLAPFYLGLLLALLLDGPISYLEGKGWSRNWVAVGFVAVIFLGLPTFFTLFLLRLWQEVGSLGQWASLFSDQIGSFLQRFPVFPGEFYPLNLLSFSDTLFRWAAAIPELLLIWCLSAFSAYFICRDKRILTKFVMEQLPKRSRFGFFKLYHQTSSALWHLLRVQLLLITFSASISMLFFSLLELPYALLSGFLVGFFDLMPFLGPGLVYLALALLQLWSGNLSIAIALGLGYLLLLVVRQWGEPHLISAPLGLHPLLALVGLYLGLKAWGLVGAVLSPILMFFIQAFLKLAWPRT